MYVEGIDPGESQILVEVDPDGAGGPLGVAEDSVKVTVVEVDLSVDNDTVLWEACDGVLNYMPGYCDGVAVLSTGTSFNTVQYQGQQMKIVVEGIGPARHRQRAIHDCGMLALGGRPGNVTDEMITGGDYDDDYSFSPSLDLDHADGTMQAGAYVLDNTYAWLAGRRTTADTRGCELSSFTIPSSSQRGSLKSRTTLTGTIISRTSGKRLKSTNGNRSMAQPKR